MLDVENEEGRIYRSFTGHTKVDCVCVGGGESLNFILMTLRYFKNFESHIHHPVHYKMLTVE